MCSSTVFSLKDSVHSFKQYNTEGFTKHKGVTMVKNPLLEIKAVAFMSKEQLLLLQLLITATMTVVSSAEQMEAPTETCALIKSLILNPSPSQIAFA